MDFAFRLGVGRRRLAHPFEPWRDSLVTGHRRAGQNIDQLFQAGQGMDRAKIVDMGQDRPNA